MTAGMRKIKQKQTIEKISKLEKNNWRKFLKYIIEENWKKNFFLNRGKFWKNNWEKSKKKFQNNLLIIKQLGKIQKEIFFTHNLLIIKQLEKIKKKIFLHNLLIIKVFARRARRPTWTRWTWACASVWSTWTAAVPPAICAASTRRRTATTVAHPSREVSIEIDFGPNSYRCRVRGLASSGWRKKF